MLSVFCLHGKSDLKHGNYQRGRDSVAGDVSDENAELIAFERKEIVEIAGDGTHGKIAGCDFDSGQVRNFARQDGCLNLLGDFKFFLNREKTLLLGENAVSNEVTQAEIAPPWVQTDLMGSNNEPRAMPLAEFIKETIGVLGTDAQEVLVERAKPLRNNPGPNEGALVTQFNDSMLQQS
jgi:hypothetical protein